MAEPGKLYLTKDRLREPTLLELKGNVSIQVFGSLNEKDTVADLTIQTPLLTDDEEYTLTGLPRYVAFIGTADRINVEGYDLTYIKDIS